MSGNNLNLSSYCLIVAKESGDRQKSEERCPKCRTDPEMAEEADTSGPYDRLVNTNGENYSPVD